jgi:hypothetical protein
LPLLSKWQLTMTVSWSAILQNYDTGTGCEEIDDETYDVLGADHVFDRSLPMPEPRPAASAPFVKRSAGQDFARPERAALSRRAPVYAIREEAIFAVTVCGRLWNTEPSDRWRN